MVNVMLEAWSDGASPGSGPMHNQLRPGVFDTQALSWGSYGVRRGIHNLLGVLSGCGVTATVFVSGVVGEREPDLVREIADAGHEIAAHSWAQDVLPAYLSPDEEARMIDRCRDVLGSATGVAPVGWGSPRGTPSLVTDDLLVKSGYTYTCDVFDDDLPYVHATSTGNLVHIPFTTDVNDLPATLRYGNVPSSQLQVFNDTAEYMVDRAPGSQLLHVTAHAHVFGRPHGVGVFERILKSATRDWDMWLTTGSQIAALTCDAGHEAAGDMNSSAKS